MRGRSSLLLVLAGLVAAGAGAFFILSAPRPLAASDVPNHVPDAKNGERLYHVAGCFSCHKPSAELAGADGLPAGGTPFKTPVGTFYPPNLTPDAKTGIGDWSDIQFINAVQRGLSPEGQHLVPAFPYTSYARMKTEDVLDIKAYLMTLPPVTAPEKPAETVLPEWLLRPGVGLWKWLGLDTTPWADTPDKPATWNLGAYLVNTAGHCNECHTPRGLFMLPDWSHKLAGGPHPGGEGKVPSLIDLIGRGKYTDAADLAMAFQNGEMMGYEHMASGGMGDVQTNLSLLPQADVDAIAEYVASLK